MSSVPGRRKVRMDWKDNKVRNEKCAGFECSRESEEGEMIDGRRGIDLLTIDDSRLTRGMG